MTPPLPRLWHDDARGGGAYLVTATGRWRIYDVRHLDAARLVAQLARAEPVAPPCA